MKIVAYSLRFLWIAYIVYKVITIGQSALLGKVIIFAASLPVLYFALKDERYYRVDAAISLLFLGTFALAETGHQLVSSVLGLDKLFHFLMGAAVGYFGLLVLERWKKEKTHFALWLIFCLLVFIGWETFEWFEFFSRPQMALTMLDSVLDVVAGLLGAIVVLVWQRFFQLRP